VTRSGHPGRGSGPLGPHAARAGGPVALTLVSDDNFSATQRTRLLVLAARGPRPEPSPQEDQWLCT
jgi:hypothetical protein